MSFDSQKVSSFLKRTAVVAVGVAAVFAAGGARAADVCSVSDLQFLEYAESTGSQYIDLEVKPNGAVPTVRIDYAMKVTTDDKYAFGYWNSNSSRGTAVGIYKGQLRYRVASSAYFYGTADTERHVVEMNTASGTFIDGTCEKPELANVADPENSYGCYAFGRNNTGTAQPVASRIYSLAIDLNGVSTRDFLPAHRISDGVVGLWDRVSKRFFVPKGGTLTAGPVNAYIIVAGDPVEVGKPTPDYGICKDVAIDESKTFTCPAVYTNAAADVAATCRGWTFSLTNGTETSGSELTKTITYDATMAGATLTWNWDVEYKVTSVDGVTVSSNWVAPGSVVTLTATPPAGKVLSRWIESFSGDIFYGNPLTVAVTAPKVLTPVYGNAHYVATTGNDTTGDGTEEMPYKTIEKALTVAASNDTVFVKAGTYTASAVISLTNAIAVCGMGSKPEDVIVKASGSHRMFYMNNTGARLSALTIQDGSAAWGSGVHIGAKGGAVVSSVIRNCNANGWGNNGGGIYMLAPADANVRSLVDRCVVSNCTAHCEAGGGNGIRMAGGIVRNTLLAGNYPNRINSGNNICGAVYMSGGELVNCTITRNSGGGLYTGVYTGNATPKVRNCIICKNTKNGAADPATGSWGGTESCFANCVCSIEINGGCSVEADPFTDYARCDYTPSLKSDALDACATEPWMVGTTDMLGVSRVSGTKADIGAFELDQSKFTAQFEADSSEGISPVEVTFTVRVAGATASEVACYWDWNGDGEPDEMIEGLSAAHTFSDSVVDVALLASNKTTGATCPVPSTVRIKAVGKTLYVRNGSTTALPPYSSWRTAAATIADAVSVAIDGCTVLLSNGTYAVTAATSLSRGVTVRGSDGVATNVIVKPKNNATGFRAFSLANSDAAVCDLTVQGFSNVEGAGIYVGLLGGTVSNCVVRNCAANGYGQNGGGIYLETPNTASVRTLVDSCLVSNCTAHCETGGGNGIRMAGGIVRNTVLTFNKPNRINSGNNICGAVYMTGGELVNCTVARNSGGGLYTGVYTASATPKVRNCIICKNVKDEAAVPETGSWGGTGSCFTNCVCSIAIDGGTGCFTETDPFTDCANNDFTPLLDSDAIDACEEEDWMTGAKDVLGNERISGKAADIGAVEYQQGALTVGYSADVPSGLAPHTVTFTAAVVGGSDDLRYSWDLDGNGTFETETQVPTVTHTYTGPCAPVVGLKVVDEGASPVAEAEAAVKTTIRVFGEHVCVSKTSANPAEPYDTWTNAAHDFEAALAVACGGCEIVVSNGTYDISAEQQIVTNVTIRGLTGDWGDVTLRSKSGSGKHRLFLLNHPAVRIENVTLSGADADSSWGAGAYIGARGGTLYRCAIVNCLSAGYGGRGGGVYLGSSAGLVDSCRISGCRSHTEAGSGGAALSMSGGLAINCIITGNDMSTAGGSAAENVGSVQVTGGTFAHGIVVGNKNGFCPGIWATGGEVINCVVGDNATVRPSQYNTCWVGTESCFKNCIMDIETIPASCMTEAVTNMTFKDYAHADYRLQSGSKGRDGGVYREWMATAKDVRGQPRKLGKAPDCGIYETGGGFTLIVR